MRRLIVLGALLVAVICLGAAWYGFVEQFSTVDAFYQAITTLSTVGFQEVHPLDQGGRIFTMFYILGGVGLLFYTATTAVETIVLEQFADRFGLLQRARRVRKMERHFIICGFGRVGREVAEELNERHEAYVIVDRNEATLARSNGRDVGVVHGDATEEATLRAAGIERARGIIAAADSDVENTYIVLTARALNPDLFIVARAGTDSADARMRSAGADRVVSPYRIGGRRMALSAVQPMLVEVFDTLTGQRGGDDGNVLCEIVVEDDAATLTGQTLAEAFPPDSGLQVLGIARAGGALEVGPRGGATLQLGDRLMLFGDREAIARLSPATASRR